MEKKRSRKGFTLVEMAIAIAVLAIVFGMVTLMSVSISGFSKEKAHITDCHEEVTRAQQFINNWARSLDDAFNTNYAVSSNGKTLSVKSGLYWFKDANNSFDLTFDGNTGVMSGDFYINGTLVPKTETFKKLKQVTFQKGDSNSAICNTVKCLLVLDDGSVYTLLLEKESSKTGLSVIFHKPYEKKNGSSNEFIFITSADWDDALNQIKDKDLQEVAAEAPFNYSAAYHYSAMSLIRVQVDHQARMSLEAFTSAYGATWKVRLFNAAGKIAYGMTLPDTPQFQASNHRLSFFIEEGSVLYDGTPVEPLGYTRQAGVIGTLDWHDAAKLTFVSQSTDQNGMWWLDFDTNIEWDEMNATSYSKLQYSSVRNLYGLIGAFGIGIDDGIFITIGNTRTPLSTYANTDKVEVVMNNQGTNGTVRVRLGLSSSLSYTSKEVSITFTTKFILPDGTPLREENAFLCKSAKNNLKKAVAITAAGEHIDTATDQLWLDFFVHTPWTDANYAAYEDLQDSSATTAYNLPSDFLSNLYDRVFIGKDGVETALRTAKDTMKLKISLMPYDDERMLLRLAINNSDRNNASYPFDFEMNSFSIRFGDNAQSGNNMISKQFILPNGVPVRLGTLARIKGEIEKAPWLSRHTLSTYVTSVQSGKELQVTITSNGPWIYQANQSFSNVLSNNQGFSVSFINSLKNKVKLTIGSTEKTLAEWGTGTVDVDVLQKNGRWALRLKVKNNQATGKDLTIKFLEGFVGPDGTTLVVPINFVRNGGSSWTGSTNPDLFFPKRTVSVVSTDSSNPAFSVTVKSAALSGSTPYYIYARVKLENSIALNSSAKATIKLDFGSSSDKTFTITADTGGWVTLADLNQNGNVTMAKENVTITFQMTNMTGNFTVADLIIADANGNIRYSMANDTTLYGVGDVRNVININSTKSSWATSSTGSYPIITRGDSNYIPNRVISITTTSSYDGTDTSLFLDPRDFTQGVTYYVTGRIRTSVANKSGDALNPKAKVSGAGTTQNYGVANGEWVALANPDGSHLSFTGGLEEIPTQTITNDQVHRSVGIGAYRNASNAKMVFLREEFNKNHTPGLYVVHGYYKVTTYRANDGSNGADQWFIGSSTKVNNVTQEITGRAGQGTWTYFRLIWDSSKDNLNFGFWEATGGLYIANLTIEDSSHNRKYDLAIDGNLPKTNENFYQPEASHVTKGYWYFYPGKDANGNQNHCTFDIYITARTTTETPKQYTITKTEKIPYETISKTHRALCVASSGKTINGKMSLLGSSFSDGTWRVHGYYYIDAYADITSDGHWSIGSGASKGTITGKGTTGGYKHFDLTWDGKGNLTFEFWMARGGMYIANLVVEDVNGKRVYDMAKDSMIPQGYLGGPVIAPNNCAWWFGYSANSSYPETSVTFSGGTLQTTDTPNWYYLKDTLSPINTISSTVRELGIGTDNNLPYGKMALQYDKVQAAYGNNTYIVRGYYKVTGYKANDGAASGSHYYIIGENATSGTKKASANQTAWTYFELEWTPSKGKNLYFQFVYATGNMYLANLTIEKKADHSSNRTVVYQLAHDTKLVRLTTKDNPDSFPQMAAGENGIWYFHPGGIEDSDRKIMDYVVSALKSTETPKQYQEDYDYIKFAIQDSYGTLEIADLQIYYINSSGNRVYVYKMATDSKMSTNATITNSNGAIGSYWNSWEWLSSSTKKFTINITNNNVTTPAESQFEVPKFTESAG